MIRFAALGASLLVLSLSASAQDKKDLEPFQGSWKLLEAKQGGRPAPKELLEKLSFAFEGEKMIVTEAGKAETGSFAVDAKKEPATIDIVSPKGNKSPGIYKFDKDGKLTVAFIKGENATRPKGFEDAEATLLVMEKVKK